MNQARRYLIYCLLLLVVPEVIFGLPQDSETGIGFEAKALATKVKPQSSGSGGAEKKISINVREKTVESALREIARQGNMQVFYENRIPALSRKISLAFTNLTVDSALARVIKGTNLVTKISPDGKTIMISSDPVSSEKQQDGKKGVVRGRVVDSTTGAGISGATVSIPKYNLSVVTNKNGSFLIKDIPEGRNFISVKIFGFSQGSYTVDIGNNLDDALTFYLKPVATALNEVVTTATGSQRKIEIGNDIVKIDPSEIMNRAPARSVSDILRYAQIPGVQVMTASGDLGAPTKIRMRGIGSITQNTDPAIIVDGMWVNSSMSDSSIINQAGGTRAYGGLATKYASSPLDNIDPSIIESIEIVRGPSAASLYGQEAANGVIVITTKRGRPGQTSWNYSFSRDWDDQTRPKYGKWIPYGYTSGGLFSDRCNISNHYKLGCVQDSAVDIHSLGGLLDETGPATSARHSASVRGGVSSITYNFSVSHQDIMGTRRNIPAEIIRFRRLNIPIGNDIINPNKESKLFLGSSVAFQPRKNLSFDVSVNTTNSNLRQNTISTGLNIFGLPYNGADTVSIMGESAALADIFRVGTNSFSLKSGFNMRYNPDTWWSAQAVVGADRNDRQDSRKEERRTCDRGLCQPLASGGSLRRGEIKSTVLTGRTSANGVLSTRFDRWLSVHPSIGIDIRRSMVNNVTFGLVETPFGADQSSGDGSGSIGSNDLITAGYFVSTSLKVLDRLYFDLGFRQDAGSVIKMNSSSRYPKLATSWLVSDENFFPQNNILSLLRLRGAIGYAAVHPEAADLSGAYSYSTAVINGKQIIVSELNTVGNNNLVPERSMEVEGGFDADVFGDRINLTMTLAHKTLRNAIVTRNLPISSGVFGSRKENIARVDNRSFEVSVNTRVIDNDAMLLELQTGISNVNNVIKRLGDKVTYTSNTSRDRIVEGYQVGAVWARPVIGFSDADKNGFIDGTEVLLGDTTVYQGWNIPKFNASYSGSIAILNRSLTLSFALSHVGPRVQKATYRDNYGTAVVGAPVELQAFSIADSLNGGATMRVSEVRLMSSSVSYNLPRSVIRHLRSKLVTVSLQGSNLGLWTNYSGRDPMVNSTPVGNAISDDGFTLPLPRKFAFNIRMEL